MAVADHDLDLGPATRDALIGNVEVAPFLDLWANEPAAFTRRPVPASAGYPMIIVNTPAALGDEDGLISDRPVIQYDVAIYGRVGSPGTADDHTRIVEELGFAVRRQFHRNRWALQVGGFHVIDVRASGPVPAPVDDDKEVGRVVSLTVRLRRNG